MKPSEYVKRGCELRPNQTFHMLTDMRDASCAVAALVEGYLGHEMFRGALSYWRFGCAKLAVEMPWLFCEIARCPVADCTGDTPWGIAVHLNNLHRWSREEIGEWLDLQQDLGEEPPSPAREVEVEEEREAVLA